MEKTITKLYAILIVLIIGCESNPPAKKKIIHEIIDEGKYFYDSNANYMKYVFFKDGKYYKIKGGWNANTRQITPNFICTCKPYFKGGDYLNCVADGIVIEYQSNSNAIFFMDSDTSDCISFHDFLRPMGRIIVRDPKNRVIYTGQAQNQLREGRFIYYDTSGHVKKIEFYSRGVILKTIEKR